MCLGSRSSASGPEGGDKLHKVLLENSASSAKVDTLSRNQPAAGRVVVLALSVRQWAGQYRQQSSAPIVVYSALNKSPHGVKAVQRCAESSAGTLRQESASVLCMVLNVSADGIETGSQETRLLNTRTRGLSGTRPTPSSFGTCLGLHALCVQLMSSGNPPSIHRSIFSTQQRPRLSRCRQVALGVQTRRFIAYARCQMPGQTHCKIKSGHDLTMHHADWARAALSVGGGQFSFCYSILRSCSVQFRTQSACTVHHVAGADGSCICNVVDCSDCFFPVARRGNRTGAWVVFTYLHTRPAVSRCGPSAVEKRNETKRKGKMENKRKTPGPLAASSLHRIGTPNSHSRAGQDAWRLCQEMDPRDPASTGPQPDGTPSVPASTNRTFFEIRVACPSLPLQGGGRLLGGTRLDRGPPRCISVCPASFLSPTLRQSHQGIWAGNRGCISRCRLFWSRVSQMARPRPPPPPPSPSITSSTPPLGPKSCTSHTTTPSPLAQPFHASLHRMRSWDRQCVAICQSHQAPSTTLPFPPSSPRRPPAQSMDGPIPQPRKGYFAICNLQSAPAGQTPVSVVITSMDLHHTTLAQRPGVAFADLACVDTVMVLSRH